MVYDLPFKHVKELGPIFRIMDSKQNNAKKEKVDIGAIAKMSKE